jgi:hypothetical protein
LLLQERTLKYSEGIVTETKSTRRWGMGVARLWLR